MRRILLITIAFWVLLLSPGLCLSGALEHFCDDSPRETTCHHEDECANDPCAGEILRPETSASLLVLAIEAAPLVESLAPAPDRVPAPSFLDRLFFPDRTRLPLPDSALPLLS